MTCVHLQQLYKLCREHDLRVGSSDLIRVVCHQCGVQEACPSMLIDETDDAAESPPSEPAATTFPPRQPSK